VLTLYYDPIYTEGLAPSVRFPRERNRLLAKRLQHAPSIQMQRPRRANRAKILCAHQHTYVEQGDGTAAILVQHSDIFTCSIHCESNFPFGKQQSDLDVHLADDTDDRTYLNCLERTLEKIRPQDYDLILYQAGVDPLAADALGKLALTREGLDQRNQRIFTYNSAHHIPIVIFMGGGYAQPIEASVDAFEDLFTAAAATARCHPPK
jgi:acetoin utilization deacetylase AcuC-like enzyme